MRSVTRLALSACVLGVLLLGSVFLLGGIDQLVPASAAFGLTAVPSLITLAWVSWAYSSASEMRLLAGLGGSMVRMAIALGGGLALHLANPARFDIPFWVWLAVFYLAFLALEMTLLVLEQGGNVKGRQEK